MSPWIAKFLHEPPREDLGRFQFFRRPPDRKAAYEVLDVPSRSGVSGVTRGPSYKEPAGSGTNSVGRWGCTKVLLRRAGVAGAHHSRRVDRLLSVGPGGSSVP